MAQIESKPGFVTKVRVYYEDTDFGGVVYYANYLKFMERARTEFLRSLGFDQRELYAQQQIVFVVKSANLEFVSPARFDDMLSVSADVEKVRRASVQFVQHCVREDFASETSSGDLIASGRVLVACVDARSFKPCALPESLKMGLNR